MALDRYRSHPTVFRFRRCLSYLPFIRMFETKKFDFLVPHISHFPSQVLHGNPSSSTT